MLKVRKSNKLKHLKEGHSLTPLFLFTLLLKYVNNLRISWTFISPYMYFWGKTLEMAARTCIFWFTQNLILWETRANGIFHPVSVYFIWSLISGAWWNKKEPHSYNFCSAHYSGYLFIYFPNKRFIWKIHYESLKSWKDKGGDIQTEEQQLSFCGLLLSLLRTSHLISLCRMFSGVIALQPSHMCFMKNLCPLL